MATFLYRLGHSAYGHRKAVLLAWVLLLAVLGGLAAGFAKGTTTTLTIPGVESIKAADLLQERFPASGAGGAAARIVFAAPAGESVTDPAAKTAIEKTVAEASKGENVASVSDPFATKAVSQSGRIAYSTVTYTVGADQITTADQSALLSSGDAAQASGLQVEYGGEAVQAQSQTSSAEGLGVLVALLVLAVTFGSLLAAGLPLVTALVGVVTGMAGVFALTSVLDLTDTAPTLGLMVGLAVGIDYALFITTRHRENLAAGLDPREAAARAVGTAGSAVVFAGATVMVALAALSVVGIPFLTAMGLVAAAMVAIAVLVALTLVPAFLGFAGGRFDRWPIPGLRRRQARLGTRPSFGSRWAGAITRKPVAFLVVAIVGAGVIALPALKLELGLPDDGTQPTNTTQRAAYDLLAEGFGPGFNGPLTIVVDGSSKGIAQATDALARQLPALDDVVAVTPPLTNPAGDTAIISVDPEQWTVRKPDQDPGHRHPRRPCRHRVPDRDRHPGHRQHGHRDRHLPEARRRAPDLPAARGGAVVPPAHARIPVPAGAAEGDARLPAQRGRHVRRAGGRLPVGLAVGRARHRRHRPDHQLPSGAAHRPALRTGDGLRGLPGQPDA